MSEMITTNLGVCVGCNRCIRECPVETVNISYQNEAGEFKVKTNNAECINCGRCVAACKHGARAYNDDTERFFEDLDSGVSLSLIVAPSVRTNIPEYKRLFTYLKNRGVKTIFDVSFGADISVWAHIRYLEKNGFTPLITQPCPAIVSYCEKHRHDLLDKLSPIHSPMACTAIYMKEYKGITDKIAALSPCIAKSNEFDDTQLVQYNVTFENLQKYLEKNKVELPLEETEYDHDESGLGVIFPMPGGLKENLESYFGKKISISRADGFSVYAKLNTYAETPAGHLPDIFDVLNCAEGCNIGSAVANKHNYFEVVALMNQVRNRTKYDRQTDRPSLDSLYQIYDTHLDLSRFMRQYRKIARSSPIITEEGIEKAFELLGKADYEKQHIDCGACGSESCYDMARKIALGVNMPPNCVVKTMIEARKEHEEKESANKQLICSQQQNEIQLTKLRTTVEAVKIGLWEKKIESEDLRDPASAFMWSDEVRHMLGYTDETDFPNLLGSWSERLHPEDKEEAFASVERHILDKTGKTPYESEYRLQKKNGEYGYFCSTGATLRDADGTPRHIVGSLRDITNTKNALYKHERQIIKLNLVVQAAHIGLWEMPIASDDPINPNNTRIYTNEYRRMLGFTDEIDFPDLFGSWMDRLHPEDKEETLACVMRHIRDKTGGYNYDREVRLRKKNGEYGYFRSFAGSFRDENGNALYTIGALMDISDAKKALHENELQLLKLKLATEATKIGLWEFEAAEESDAADSHFLQAFRFHWSNGFRRLLGFTDERDFPDVFPSWSDRLHPEDKDRVIDLLAKHLSDKTGKTPYDLEYRLLKKNGEYAYYRAAGKTIRDEHGNAVRGTGTLMDITEAKMILKEEENQKRAAESANRAKTVFLSTISHEIRTPMNVILGISEIQLRNESLAPEIRDALERIANAGGLLLGIINDILDFSKIDADKMELVPIEYQMASLINDVISLNIVLIGCKNIKFELSVDPHIPATLLGDELRIKQILNNLLSNAVKYTEKGTIRLSVCVESTNGVDVMLVFKVTDTGLGMTDEQISKLFDRFTRFHMETDHSIEGIGLGMTITKNLVHMMHGKIGVTSEPYKGSEFTVHLPQKMCGTEVLGRKVANSLRNFRRDYKKRARMAQTIFETIPDARILVVDDAESNLYVAKGLLAPYGLVVETAFSGFEAIDKIKAGNEYSIIFMDHMMPKMDGLETTKTLREMGYKLPIIALTADAVSGRAEMFLENGFDGFVSKPIDIRELNTVVKHFAREKLSSDILLEAAKKQKSRPVHTEADPQLIASFLHDAHRVIAALELITDKRNAYTAKNLREYAINAHAMKSALAYIGETDLSELAGQLEQAAEKKDTVTIAAITPKFLDGLRMLVAKLTPKEKENAKMVSEDYDYLREQLLSIHAACENFDIQVAKDIITELRRRAWSPFINDGIESMAEHMLSGDYEEVTRMAETISETLKEPLEQ